MNRKTKAKVKSETKHAERAKQQDNEKVNRQQRIIQAMMQLSLCTTPMSHAHIIETQLFSNTFQQSHKFTTRSQSVLVLLPDITCTCDLRSRIKNHAVLLVPNLQACSLLSMTCHLSVPLIPYTFLCNGLCSLFSISRQWSGQLSQTAIPDNCPQEVSNATIPNKCRRQSSWRSSSHVPQ